MHCSRHPSLSSKSDPAVTQTRPRLGMATLLSALLGGLALGSGCSPVIEEGVFSCDPNAPDPCPAGFACLRRGTSPQPRCYAQGDGFCGDGLWDPEQGEECDLPSLGALVCPGGSVLCRSTCEAFCATCGNGIVERDGDQGEVCDGSDLDGQSCGSLGYDEGLLRCDAQCQLDTSLCYAFCGNGVVEITRGEECDGANLGDAEGETCTSLEWGRLGELRCGEGCRLGGSCQIHAALALGTSVACSLGSLGKLYCWGRGEYGSLGSGTNEDQPLPAGVEVSQPFVHLAAGAYHFCALEEDGTAWCWGYNESGQLGTGETLTKYVPKPVDTEIRFSLLAAGANHSCGLGRDGAVYCWGDNSACQLGTGNTISHLRPFRIAGSLSFVSLTAGAFHTCAVDTGGQAYCWGGGENGRLGSGDTLRRCEPFPVQGGLTWTTLTAGMDHTCGLDEDLLTHCWGDNSAGQLGDGTTTSRLEPVAVLGLPDASTIEAGELHTCALTLAGQAFCWGGNLSGELGTGDLNDASQPTAVTGGHLFRELQAGGWFTCGIDLEGAAWCWGDNFFGQLGTGPTPPGSTAPTLVAPSLSDGPVPSP